MIKSAAGGMVSVALECTGFESSIRTAIFVSHTTRAGGPVSRGRLGSDVTTCQWGGTGRAEKTCDD